jgi:hypothetical protein
VQAASVKTGLQTHDKVDAVTFPRMIRYTCIKKTNHLFERVLDMPSFNSRMFSIWRELKHWENVLYGVIKKEGLNFVRLYFLNYTWHVNDLHNI